LKDFCKENKLNWDNVEILRYITIYRNLYTYMKDFHEGKYGKFLFLLGKYMLTKKLNNEDLIKLYKQESNNAFLHQLQNASYNRFCKSNY
jgi:hypothetical protein